MAERYQDRPFPSDDYRGGDQHGSGDPLAELARLIGQTDPFAAQGRPGAHPPAAPAPAPARSYQDDDYRQGDDQQDHAEQAPPQPGPPSWMRRANVQPQTAPAEPAYSASVNPVHPLHRYSAQPTAPEPEPDFRQPQAYPDQAYQAPAYQAPAYQDQAYQQHDQAYQEQAYQQQAYQQPDPARYDDALYGRLEAGEQDYQRDPAYPDDPYAFQSDYPEADLDEPKKQRGGMMTVAAILALAVVGTGAAFAYKTYVGSPRSGEPPIIKADNTPTKIVPAPSDSSAKVPDRMVTGDGAEKIVPREEAPVDVNAKAGGPPRVFPPAEPEREPAAGRKRLAVQHSVVECGTESEQRHAAEQFAARDQDRGREGRSDRRHGVASRHRREAGSSTEARCGTRCTAHATDLGQCQCQSAALADAAIGAGCGAAAADGCDQSDADCAREQRWRRLRRAGLLAADRG